MGSPRLPALNAGADLPRARLMLAAIRVLWEAPVGPRPNANPRRAALLADLETVDRNQKEITQAEGSDDEVPGLLPALGLPSRFREPTSH